MGNTQSAITVLLPMKGHSERIPNKNMRDFCGRPLYHTIMNSLLQSRYISKVVVNTDSDEIKEDISKFFKDSVINHDRPGSIRGDFVSMNKIIEFDIDKLRGEHFLQTHSTNPLLKTETIDNAIKIYFQILNKGYDSLFSVTRLQKRLYDSEGRALNHNPDDLIRTQDLSPVYEENSCLYIFSRKSFGRQKRRIGKNPFMFEISHEEAWDIDEEMDFEIAEFFYKKLHAD